MTREEAIEELKEDIDLYMPTEWVEEIDRDTPDGRLITALEMAIKALEQEPILDKIRAEIDGLLNDEDNQMYVHGVMDCLEIIDKYKALSNGEWIFTTEGNTDHITCSICGRDSMGTFDYCPNCGAKMEEI